MNSDTRWRQRFYNLERAYQTFVRILEIKTPNEAEKMGLIQAFEMTFELSWKTLSDYLQSQGFDEVTTPRKALKQAFNIGIIKDGHEWMNALDNRNETTHVYDEAKAEEVLKKIRERYFPLMRQLYLFLQKEYAKQRPDA